MSAMTIKTGSTAPTASSWETPIWKEIRGPIHNNIAYDSSSYGGTIVKSVSFKDKAGTYQEVYIKLRTDFYGAGTNLGCYYLIANGSTGTNGPAANTTATFSGMNLKFVTIKAGY